MGLKWGKINALLKETLEKVEAAGVILNSSSGTIRYFTHVCGFGDDTMYVSAHENGKIFSHSKTDVISLHGWNLASCERAAVKGGSWKVITKEEALKLVK